MYTVMITGGTGMVGNVLSRMLEAKGYQVIILTRSAKNKEKKGNIRYAEWDPGRQTIDVAALQSADFIIHLAGAGVVDKKWTSAYRKEILESRTLSSKLILDNLRNHSHQVKAIISSSAIGWYGADTVPGKMFVETDPPSDDFLGTTCRLWEESIENPPGKIRVCKLRTGIVLSNDGGALAEFKKPLRFGIAGIIGDGRQMVSWIHIEDLCRMFIYAIENETLQGSYNAVAPVPVNNRKLTLTLANAVRGRFYIPVNVPSFILKIMMGSRSVEVLKSTTVSCEKIKQAGFTFLYPSIEAAISQLTNK